MHHQRRRAATIVVFAVVGILDMSGEGLAKKRPVVPPSPGGRFLQPDAAPLVQGALAAQQAIVIETPTASQVSIGETCAAKRGKVKASRKGTIVRATWLRCGSARRVRLAAVIGAGCDQMTGTVQVKGAQPRRFSAARSRCGDDLVDPGAGEQCEASGGACGGTATSERCACVPLPTTADRLDKPAQPLPPLGRWGVAAT